jgi:hypothetical protein
MAVSQVFRIRPAKHFCAHSFFKRGVIMRLLKVMAAIITCVTLAACSVTATQGVVKPPSQTSGPFGLITHDAIKVEGEKAFSGVNKVVVGGFKVGFITGKEEQEKAGTGIGGRSTAVLELQGLTPALMQEITDKAYSDLLVQLQARGYEVVERAQLTGSSEFAKANSKPSPLTEESSFFGSSNDVTYVAPSEIGKLHFFLGDTGPGGGFGFDNPSTAAATYADKSKIPVLSVAYTLDFASKNGSGGSFASTSALEVGQALSVIPGSGLNLFGGASGTFSSANGSIKLGQAITSPDSFGEIVMTTSDTMKALETASNVAGVLLGAGSSQSRDFVLKADPAKYGSAASGVLSQANQDLLQHMKGLR